ncbi:hypothetical protein BH23ACT9_BH23ACT9_17260 [soil metagenome]
MGAAFFAVAADAFAAGLLPVPSIRRPPTAGVREAAAALAAGAPGSPPR